MVITTTAVAFILLSVGLAFCGWRFLRAFLKSNDSRINSRAGLLLSLFLFASALQNGVLGLGALFFANNPDGLYSVVLLSHLFLATMAGISTYLVFYTLLPKQSPIAPISLVGVLGVFFVSATILYHPQPFLTPENGIDWGVNSPLSILMFSLFLISLAPPTYLFLKIFLTTISKELRLVSFAVAVLHLGGIINVFTRLILFRERFPTLRTQLLDVGVAIVGAGFVLVFVVVPAIKRFVAARRRASEL